MRSFDTRTQAGMELGRYIDQRLQLDDPLVLGIPRGGVIVARAVANVLDAQLDLVVIHEIQMPQHPEYAVAAVDEDGHVVTIDTVTPRAPTVMIRELEMVGVETVDIVRARSHAIADVQRRARGFRQSRPSLPIAGRDVVIVDEGITSGLTVAAAARYVRSHGATRVVVATPICAQPAISLLAALADDVVSLAAPHPLPALSRYYVDYGRVSDADVVAALESAAVMQESRRADVIES